jgi:hypothetical protein
MGRTRRSGSTAGEALPLQLHIAGPQKGVGRFSAPCPRGLCSRRLVHPSGHAVCLCACEPEVSPGRQHSEEAAETQEAETAEETLA